jgi:hypothetical protein
VRNLDLPSRDPLLLWGSLAKFLMIEPDRTSPEDPVLGTEVDRNLPSTACSRWCGKHHHMARIPLRGRLSPGMPA